MGVGRFVCLGLPFALTFASLVCILIVATGDVTNKSYFFAKFDTKNLSVSATDAISAITSRDFNINPLEQRSDIAHLTSEALGSSSSSSSVPPSSTGIAHLSSEALSNSATAAVSGTNITAADLGLADSYTVGLWNYCNQTTSVNGSTTQKCSKPKAEFWFDPFSIWDLSDTVAETAINSTTLKDALKTYKTAAKWTWVFYLVAFIFTVVELLLGVGAIFSRVFSCCTTIASNISSVAIILASILATVMWSILTASFNHELNKYGISASISGKMLAVTWLAVAFSLASGFFWMISICCCGGTDRHYSRTPRRIRGSSDAEKLVNGPYQQVGGDAAFVANPYEPTAYHPPTQQGYTAPQEYGEQTHQMTGANRQADLTSSYEPYRHNNI